MGINQYEVTFAAQSQRGTYTFAVGPDILDLDGNAMDQDQDDIFGEPGDDVYTFTVDALDADNIFRSNWEIADGDTTYNGRDIAVVGAELTMDGAHSFNSMHLVEGAVLTHTAAMTVGLDLNVISDLLIDATSPINVDGSRPHRLASPSGNRTRNQSGRQTASRL